MKVRGKVLKLLDIFLKLSNDWKSKSVYLWEVPWNFIKNTKRAFLNKEDFYINQHIHLLISVNNSCKN